MPYQIINKKSGEVLDSYRTFPVAKQFFKKRIMKWETDDWKIQYVQEVRIINKKSVTTKNKYKSI